MRNKKLLIEIIAALAIFMFLYTGVSKFIDFRGFKHDINNQPFPNSFTPFLAWAIPLVEIAIAACLFFGKTRLIGLYASLFLMLVFTVYTALVLLHVFPYVPCSCGGVVEWLSWPQHLVFNLFFVILSFAGIRLMKQQEADHFENISG